MKSTCDNKKLHYWKHALKLPPPLGDKMSFNLNFDFFSFLLSFLWMLCNKWPFMKKNYISPSFIKKLHLFASILCSFVNNQHKRTSFFSKVWERPKTKIITKILSLKHFENKSWIKWWNAIPNDSAKLFKIFVCSKKDENQRFFVNFIWIANFDNPLFINFNFFWKFSPHDLYACFLSTTNFLQ